MTKFQNGNILWSGRDIQSLSFPLISLKVMNLLCQALGVQKYDSHRPSSQELTLD